MHIRLVTVVFLVSTLFLSSGCAQKTPALSPVPPTPSTVFQSPFASPLGTLQSPLPPDAGAIVPFRLDRPIPVKAQEVTGSGPTGVPIQVVDVTMAGVLLGTGVIDRDGTFTVSLFTPLEARHRIGIALGSLAGTKWRDEDFYDDGFHGDEALNVPQIGFFFDTYMVRE